MNGISPALFRSVAATLFCVLSLQALPAVGEPGVKLGIVADAALGPAADLLTTDLSKLEGLELLERNSINRILQEQKLQLAGLSGLIQTGRLLGADGLLLLERKAEAAHDVIIFRLIAVRPGVVIHSATYPIPLKAERAGHREVADLIRLRVMRHLERLRTEESRAVRVSQLNFVAPLGGKVAIASAQRLDQMLAERLMDDPAVFVLERQKLGLAAEEKMWSGNTEPFWTGSALIDGEVRQDLSGGGRMTVTVRVRPPQAKEAVDLQEAGLLSKPEEALDRLLPRIREALGSRSTARWDSVEEGRLFFEQAQRAKEHAEKKAAIEAAWNLGYRELDAAAVRLSVEGVEAASFLERGRELGEGLELLAGAVSFARSYSENSQRAAKAEVTRQLASEKAWKISQREVLEVAGLYLEKMWQKPSQEFLHPGEARALQEQLPAIIDRIWNPSTEEGARVTAAVGRYGSFYFPSPELAVTAYRKILIPDDQPAPWKHEDYFLDNLASARQSLLLRQPQYPRFVSSSAEARRHFDTLWEALLSDFARYANGDSAASHPADRFLARYVDPATDPLELLWDAREPVSRRQLGLQFVSAVLLNPGLERRKRTAYSVKLLEYICEESAYQWGSRDYELTGVLFDPFLDSYDAAQAKRVYEALRAAAAKQPSAEPLTWYLKKSLLNVLAKHPSLRPKVDPLNVDRVIWCHEEATQGTRPSGLQWIEGRLWFYIANALVRIDVLTGAQKTIATPPEINPALTGRSNYFTVSGGNPVIVSSLDRSTSDAYVRRDGAWQKFSDVPPATVHPVILGEFLYYGFRNGHVRGIARLHLQDGRAEVLTSSEEKIRTGVFDGPDSKIERMMTAGTDEVWTRTFGDQIFCYNTGSGSWRRTDPAEWTRREEARSNVVAEKFRPLSFPGTPPRLLSLESASDEAGGYISLWLRESGKAGVKISMRFPQGTVNSSGTEELCDRETDEVMMTPHGLVFPMWQDYAICFLPYEDMELAIAGLSPPSRAPRAAKSSEKSAPFSEVKKAVLSASPADLGLQWEEFDSGMPASILNLIAQGNGLYVAAGYVTPGGEKSGGSIAVSADGTHWLGRPPRNWGGDFTGMAFGAGRFVIVGHKGLILSSEDGQDWTVEKSRVKADLLSVCFAGGLFVAVGKDGAIVTSTDGREWSIQDSRTPFSISQVMNRDGKFLAVAQWMSQPFFVTSSDGVQWSHEKLPPLKAGRCWISNMSCAGGSVILLFGDDEELALKRDGEPWSVGKLPSLGRAPSNKLSVVNGSYYLVGAGGSVFVSKDGLSWKVQSSAGWTLRGKIVQLGDWLYTSGGPGKLMRAKALGESLP